MYIAKLKTIYSWNRKRNNILWYNPPTHQHRTQIPCLVDKHFPKDHKLKKIFNRNTIKISYNCMNNTKQIIDSHNKRILTASILADDTAAAATINNKTQLPTKERIPARRELPAAISNLPSHRHTQRQQHDRNLHRTHRKRLQNKIKKPHRIIPHAKHRNSTELSKHIWTLKDKNIEHFICWRILSSRSPYNSSSKRCNPCLKEKFLIICRPKLSTLNKCNERVSSSRHRNKKALLCNN